MGKALTQRHKESADPVPYSDSGLRQPQYYYGWSLRYGAQLQCSIDFVHQISFEVAVRVRDWATKRSASLSKCVWQGRCKPSAESSLFAEVQPVLAQILCKGTNFPWKLVTEDAFFSHFYRFNHIILHERRRIPEKRAATGAVKVQIAAIRPRRARFLPGVLKSEFVLVARLKIFLKSEIESSSFIVDSWNPSILGSLSLKIFRKSGIKSFCSIMSFNFLSDFEIHFVRFWA